MAVLKYRNSQGNYVTLTGYPISSYIFDGTYDATTNKAATVSSITSRLPQLSTVVLSGTPQAYDGTHNLSVQDGTSSQKGIVQLGTTAGTAFDGADGKAAKDETDFLIGVNGTNSVANINSTNIGKRLLVVTINSSTSQTLGFASGVTLPLGRELQIIVVASGVDASISIPHDGSTWVNTVDGAGATMSVASGKVGEINIINAGTANAAKYYVRYLGA